jgi:hypothetical protein
MDQAGGAIRRKFAPFRMNLWSAMNLRLGFKLITVHAVIPRWRAPGLQRDFSQLGPIYLDEYSAFR